MLAAKAGLGARELLPIVNASSAKVYAGMAPLFLGAQLRHGAVQARDRREGRRARARERARARRAAAAREAAAADTYRRAVEEGRADKVFFATLATLERAAGVEVEKLGWWQPVRPPGPRGVMRHAPARGGRARPAATPVVQLAHARGVGEQQALLGGRERVGARVARARGERVALRAQLRRELRGPRSSRGARAFVRGRRPRARSRAAARRASRAPPRARARGRGSPAAARSPRASGRGPARARASPSAVRLASTESGIERTSAPMIGHEPPEGVRGSASARPMPHARATSVSRPWWRSASRQLVSSLVAAASAR